MFSHHQICPSSSKNVCTPHPQHRGLTQTVAEAGPSFFLPPSKPQVLGECQYVTRVTSMHLVVFRSPTCCPRLTVHSLVLKAPIPTVRKPKDAPHSARTCLAQSRLQSTGSHLSHYLPSWPPQDTSMGRRESSGGGSHPSGDSH